MSLNTHAEQSALAAQTIKAFGDVNLVGIKEKVSDALKLIGRSRVFAEYTMHDISHVDKMLESLEWLIPDETKRVMTPADWLLTVLAFYFHDLGMLVTDDEFDARNDSGFVQFCEQDLFGGDAGTDYESQVNELSDEERERFLYQEYVRRKHAERISEWIQGKATKRLGSSVTAANAITEMLRGLPDEMRQDLALICASHHQNDLYDTARYRTASPYGDSDDATANVQYAALLLRSADLLHITKDRTPSVMFRLINPRDPVSQREWAKQDAVTRVKAQKGRNSAGDFDDEAAKDAIEVFATFKNADAFFGLTSYLDYAEKQLRQVSEWAKTSSHHFDNSYFFPWRRIDTTEIRADGFSPHQLSFSLDQEKILELLTGHTLYNETGVVLREIVQNALDATRLQALLKEKDEKSGQVIVEWESSTRELIVRDNGTGMSAHVIERNLLRAGASRYQEEDFKKRHPKFSPISRFGIGVLSAFMVADFVQITTCTEEEEKARQLTLRSVHGRYLVRLLDKEVASKDHFLEGNGTEVRLRVRKSAKFPSVADTLRRWIVIPRCGVTAIVDGDLVADIGFDSPAAALTAALRDVGHEVDDHDVDSDGDSLKVIETTHDGISTAFAVRWDRYFRQWDFLRMGRLPDGQRSSLAVGTCVEGVRVEETSAGFAENSIVGLVDARGLDAPKTNVARSGLDQTAERTEMLHRVYRSYLRHIAEESQALHAARGQSITWAAQEAEVLLGALLEKERRGGLFAAVHPMALEEEIKRQPLVLIEVDGERSMKAGCELQEEGRLWTVDSGLVRAAERILREIPGKGSLHAIASGFERGGFSLPEGMTLVGYQPGSLLYQLVLDSREVSHLIVRADQRRVDLGWDLASGGQIWLDLTQIPEQFSRARSRSMLVARNEINLEGLNGEIAIRAHNCFYLLPATPIAQWLIAIYDEAPSNRKRIELGSALASVVSRYFSWFERPDDIGTFLENALGNQLSRRGSIETIEEIDLDSLSVALEETPHRIFDTWAWHRGHEWEP